MVVGGRTVLYWRAGGRRLRLARAGAQSIVGVQSHCRAGSWCFSALFPVISAGKRIRRQLYFAQPVVFFLTLNTTMKPSTERLPS